MLEISNNSYIQNEFNYSLPEEIGQLNKLQFFDALDAKIQFKHYLAGFIICHPYCIYKF